MEKLNFTLLLAIILILLGLIGFWSFNTLQTGSEHKLTEEIDRLKQENNNLREEAESLEDELFKAEAQLEVLDPKEKPDEVETPEPTYPTPASTPSKYDPVIGELQALITENVLMKVGSRGTRVGTVQRFLNIYNGTSSKVDNDYGESTKKAVAAFQKAQGLTADGEAGPGTFQKMIDWLKKQS